MRFVFFLLIALVLAGAAEADDIARQAGVLDAEINKLKQEREQDRVRAQEAGIDADRFLTQNWLSYRSALKRQEYFQHRAAELDAEISRLEGQKQALESNATK